MRKTLIILLTLFCVVLYSQDSLKKDTVFCFNDYEINKITEIILTKDSLEVELNNCNNKVEIYQGLYNNVSKIKDSYALEIETYKEFIKNENVIVSDLNKSNLQLKNQIKKNKEYFKYSIALNIVLITFLIIK